MKPPRSDSPKQTRKVMRTDGLRQRQDRNADEIIRFVRDIQFDRQPSSLGFHKKAPLPGIGQNIIKNGTSDSGFLDRGLDSTDSDNDSLDNEILHAQQKKSTRRVDPCFIEMLTCPRGMVNTSNDYDILSRSISQYPQDVCNNNIQKVSRQNSFIRHGKKPTKVNGFATTAQRNNYHGNMAKQLPPLPRDSAPERPSAPSPSRTPPISDYSFIEEEPVDYLDLS